jgi:hypothetical protein
MNENFLRCLANWITEWGPGILIALIMLYGLYKLVYKIAINVGLKIVAALEKPSEALSLQARSMDRLTESIQQYVSLDQTEHREIIILLKVIADKINRIEEKRDGS